MRRRPLVTAPSLIVGRADDLEADGEGDDVVEDGTEDDEEDVACGAEDPEEDEEDTGSPSACKRVSSSWNEAETPEELLHVFEFGVPTPETKFTAIHCS